MFEVWRLNRALRKTQRSFERDREKLRSKKAPRDEFMALDADEYHQVNDIEQAIDFTASQSLLHVARSLDVEVPPIRNSQMWIDDGETGKVWLSPAGRAHVRKLIYEEKARSFEAKTLWLTKFWLPLLAVAVGIIGALTGLFAVLHKK
jgi:hypothetical protein